MTRRKLLAGIVKNILTQRTSPEDMKPLTTILMVQSTRRY
jgi:hypothetical protein